MSGYTYPLTFGASVFKIRVISLIANFYSLIVMQSFLNRTIRLTAIASLPAALLAMVSPSLPAAAHNQFDVCVEQIKESGVPGDQAGTACADAIIPKELSWCVRKIGRNTPVPAEDALTACYRVRRPVDLGNCVADIYKDTVRPYVATQGTNSETTSETGESISLLVLDSCRRSLLPGRHSECVIALGRRIENASPAKAMEACLNAEDFPRDLFPAYTDE